MELEDQVRGGDLKPLKCPETLESMNVSFRLLQPVPCRTSFGRLLASLSKAAAQRHRERIPRRHVELIS